MYQLHHSGCKGTSNPGYRDQIKQAVGGRQLQSKLTTPKVLTHYNPQFSTKISADASYVIGAVLLQQTDENS